MFITAPQLLNLLISASSNAWSSAKPSATLSALNGPADLVGCLLEDDLEDDFVGECAVGAITGATPTGATPTGAALAGVSLDTTALHLRRYAAVSSADAADAAADAVMAATY